ncbi:putative entry exclusion protein TrbK-alt [Paenirhodobacter hankyongi]|uniref:Conjugal transfer protein TrbK n=1 Tax=Paenirhodobacter hankyongi TaxID=2294033 RepID=A0A421BK49_9RHOB|nr:putative entry exclusion protein TrbK-alt [Sinirhodobacter hankyongi]RLL62914.1 conjugal transfer protein TrbK [Sinirhodobacter hankyongi]
MDSRTLTRVAAVALLAVALTASLIAMSWPEDAPPRAISAAPAITPADPLREGQRRCQQMGEAAANDPDCMAIWAETRDRFLGRDTGSRDAEH